MASMEEGFVTVGVVAELLKLNPQSAPATGIDAGQLPAYRLGRRVRIGRSDFDALVAAGEITKSAPAESPPASIWDGEIPPPQVPS